MTTPAQHKADDDLRQAIINHALAYEMVVSPATELLNEYAVVAHWQRLEGDGTSTYTTHYHQSPCPHHTAIGLFTTGADLVAAESEDHQ